jgi:hypothetical protein
MYVKAAEYAKRFTVNPQTLRRWADAGKINYKWSPGGIRLYELPGDGAKGNEEEKVVYARVSSAKQKDDLQRQADFLLSKFPGHRLVTDVGSGINWRRKGLLSLLDAADQGALAEVMGISGTGRRARPQTSPGAGSGCAPPLRPPATRAATPTPACAHLHTPNKKNVGLTVCACRGTSC